jgi:tryptophan synthase alpha chain
MSQISAVFKPGYKALIAYITLGYPTLETSYEAAITLAGNGCDIIELGIPFSDPLADGTTIQQASYQALKQGITVPACLDTARRLSQQITTPLVFMGYFNPILSFGIESFSQAAAKAGVSGLIIPDLPPEEGTELELTTQRLKLDLIYLLAPTSTEERISLVSARSRGFIYLVSLTGVTGARQTLPPELDNFVRRVRAKATQPLCVGFGISNPEQAERVAQIADGVIVGSRLIQLIDEDTKLTSLKSFVQSLRRALNQAH